ncbi:MAG: thiol-disulfide oxidoreductase DCC family protein [Chloroflexota bacterium]
MDATLANAPEKPAGSRAPASTAARADVLTILYDGSCGFCTRQATIAARLAGSRRTRLVSTAEPGVRERYGLTQEGTRRQLHVQDASGRTWGGAAAVARLLRAVPIIGVAGWLYYVPGLRHFADAAYGWVSRHRYAISRRLGWDIAACEGDACDVRT